MSVFQHLETVTLELHIAIEIQRLESVDGYLLVSSVLRDVGLALESQVGGDWPAWESDFRVLAWCKDGGEVPECCEQREAC